MTRAAMLAMLLAATGCDRTWNTTLVRLDRPIAARLTRVTTQSGLSGKGHSGEISVAYAIDVDGLDIHHEFVADCDGDLEMVSDPHGNRLAFRCPGNEWRVLYLGSEGRAFELATPISAELDWSAIPDDVDRAAATLYRDDVASAQLGFEPDEAAAVLAEVRHRRGDRGLARFLLEVADAKSEELTPCASNNPAELSSWRVAHDALPAPDRAYLDRALATIVQTPLAPGGSAVEALDKATAILDLDGPALAGAWRARLGELLARPTLDDARPAEILLRWWSRHDPANAGALACSAATAMPIDDRGSPANKLTDGLVLAIAHSQTPCPALAERAGAIICNDLSTWFCGPGPLQRCDPADFARAVETEMAHPTTELRDQVECGGTVGGDSFLPAALTAGGSPLAPALERKTARARYHLATVEDTGGLPACDDATTPVGAECWCSPYREQLLCMLPASETVLVQQSCRFTIDDATQSVSTTATGVVDGP